MSAEIEAREHLSKAARVRNVKRGNSLQKAVRYMTHTEKDAKQNELKRVEETLSPHNVASSSITPEGRSNLARYRNYLQEDLSENVAPEVSSEVLNHTLKRERELAEEIRAGMLPVEVMRRNPPGAVGQYLKAEGGALKTKILEWKNLRRLNNPGDESEDLANVELLRPSMAGRGTPTTFIADAQIPGYMAYGHIPDERWEASGLPLVNENSPLAQAERRESAEDLEKQIAELKAQLASKDEKKTKAEANRQAASERMKKFHAERKAAKAQQPGA